MAKCLHCNTKFEKKQKWQQGRFKFCIETDECYEAFAEVRKSFQKQQNEKKCKREVRFKKTNNPEVYASDNKKTLQDEINHIARLIDKDCRCIDCERTVPNPYWDGGHRTSRGSHPALRYHLDNIFKQDRYCNSISEGNKQAYNDGVKEMYGEKYFDYIDGLKLKYPVLRISNAEIPERIKEARKIVRELKKLDMVYTPKQRIKLREKYNKRLGIYE